MDKSDVAGVLEEAARLYRDEKVEWCSGSWVEVTGESYNDWNDDLGIETPGLKLSVCAEGALLRAAGFSWQEISDYGSPNDDLLQKHPSFKAFEEARLALVRQLSEQRGRRTSVHSWNDRLGGPVEECKEKVVELFEATAKDLRNGE